MCQTRTLATRSFVFEIIVVLMVITPGIAYCSSVNAEVSLEENPSCANLGFTANAIASYTCTGADHQELQAGGEKEYKWVWEFDGTVVRITTWGTSAQDSLHHAAVAGDDHTLHVTVYARVSGSGAGLVSDTETAPPVVILSFDITDTAAVGYNSGIEAEVLVQGTAAPAGYGNVWCNSHVMGEDVTPDSISGGWTGETLNWELSLGRYEADTGSLWGEYWDVDGHFSGATGPCADTDSCQLTH